MVIFAAAATSRGAFGVFSGLWDAGVPIVVSIALIVLIFAIFFNGVMALRAYVNTDANKPMGMWGDPGGAGKGGLGTFRDYIQRMIYLAVMAVVVLVILDEGPAIFNSIAGGVGNSLNLTPYNPTSDLGPIFGPIAEMIIQWGSSFIVFAFIAAAAWFGIRAMKDEHAGDMSKAQENLKYIGLAFVISLTVWVSLIFGPAIIVEFAKGVGGAISNGTGQ